MSQDPNRNEFPAEYVRAQLLYVKEKYQLSMVELAGIMGYERAALHRLLKNRCPSITALYQLSDHLGLPMSFWFPSQEGIVPLEIVVPPPPDCVCEGHAPLTKEIVQAIGRLPAVQKYQLLAMIEQNPTQLSLLVQLFGHIAPLGSGDRERLVLAVGTIAAAKKEPALS